MRISRMKNILPATLAVVLTISFGASAMEITPGGLRQALGGEAATVTALTLTGSADARDMSYAASLPALRELDMSGLNIVALQSDTAVILNRRHFPANTVPAFAFTFSNIEKVVLPAGLTSIEECAFASSPVLSSVTFGNKLQNIGDWAFYSTALITVTLPASLRSMGQGVFASCKALSDVGMAATALNTLPAKTFRGCGSLRSITFPSALSGIGDECMYGSGLESLQLPASVNHAGAYAFSSMPRLRNLDVNSANLGEGVLYANPELTYVTGMQSYPTLAVAASPRLRLDSVASSSITSLGAYALADNPTDKLWLSDRLDSVAPHALDGMTALRTIQGFYMHGAVPDAADGAFDGLENIGDISLWVDKDHESSWINHPEWGRFKIIGTTVGVESNIADGSDALNIECIWHGDLLSLNSTEPMAAVIVYDAAGMVLAASAPRSVDAAMDMSGISAKVIIVRATTARGARTFKLRRNG